MPATRPTLATIADSTGVSRMTVSRALRNAPEIDPETRDHVLRTAERLGYHPDPKLAAVMHYLRWRRRDDIAKSDLAYVRYHAGAGEPGTSESQARFLTGMTKRAAALGFAVDRFVIGPKHLRLPRLASILAARGIEGTVFAGASELDTPLDPVLHQTACCVTGTHHPEWPVHRATSHHYASIRIAIEHLRAAGHRRIGLYLDRLADGHILHAWRAGLSDHLSELGLKPAPLLRLVPDWDRDDFLAWVRHARPEAVLTLHRPAAAWLANLPRSRRPLLALLDRSREERELPGLDQNHEDIGAAAVDLVTARIRARDVGPARRPYVISVVATWVDVPRSD